MDEVSKSLWVKSMEIRFIIGFANLLHRSFYDVFRSPLKSAPAPTQYS
jgi:hypothetical protein